MLTYKPDKVTLYTKTGNVLTTPSRYTSVIVGTRGRLQMDNEGADLLMKQFLILACRADEINVAANRITYDLQNLNHPWRTVTAGQDYAIEAVAAATFFLGAATNSFLSLRLLTIDTDAISAGETTLKANFSINGTTGLIRQTLECASRAFWLVSAKDLDQLIIRGFAATWENADAATSYANAIQAPDLASKQANREVIRQDGLAKGIMDGEAGKEKPKFALGNATDILRGRALPPELIRGLESAFGQKVGNGEWVYRWLSGMAHGFGWVHPMQNSTLQPEEEVQVMLITTDWSRLLLSLVLTEALVRDVVRIFDSGPIWLSAG